MTNPHFTLSLRDTVESSNWVQLSKGYRVQVLVFTKNFAVGKHTKWLGFPFCGFLAIMKYLLTRVWYQRADINAINWYYSLNY